MKNTVIAIVGVLTIAGIYFYKKYEEGMEAHRNKKVSIAKTIKKIPRKKTEDIFYEKTCNVPGYSCKDFGLDSKKEEGIFLKDKILYIVKNYKYQNHRTKKIYDDLDITEKVRAQAYAYSVHPKVLGVLAYKSILLAVRIYIVHDDYGSLKLLQGFELTKEQALKIPVELSRSIPEELFVGGNIKLADEYFKDKLKVISKK